MGSSETQTMIHNASQVRRIAEEMDHINNVKLLDAADSIAAVWRGEAADVFLQHNMTTRDQVRKTINELQRVANDIERSARELESITV